MSLFVPSLRKAHSLTGRITPELVETAFKAVKRNRGAAGVDRVSIDMFEKNKEVNLASILRDLKDGSLILWKAFHNRNYAKVVVMQRCHAAGTSLHPARPEFAVRASPQTHCKYSLIWVWGCRSDR